VTAAPAGESAARRIARNAASILIGDAAGELLIGYSIALAAVSLGPRGFGTLSEAQAFMDPFEAAAAFGLGNVALRFAASRGDCDGTLRGTVFGIRLASALVGVAFGLVVALLTGRGELWPLLVTIAVGMLLTPVNMVSLLPFQWRQSVHRRIAVPFFVGAVRLGGAYAAYWFLRSPLGFQLAWLAAAVASVIINLWWVRRVYPDVLRFDRELAKTMFSIGWPAGVLEFVVILYLRASYFFLHANGAHEQGEFAAADRMIRPILAIAGAVVVSSMPTIAVMAVKQDFATLRASYRQSLIGIALGVTPILAALWFLAAWLLNRFAPVYVGSIWPFRVLAVGAFFMSLNMMSTTFIMALGRFRIIMTIALVNLFTYLLLATRLVPAYGALGAAASTTVMESINAVIQALVVFYLLRRLEPASS
jgi:O-antigen/teichoic acid export membrane protein